MKYKGYIERERLIADKMHRLEDIKINFFFNDTAPPEIYPPAHALSLPDALPIPRAGWPARAGG